MKILITGGAGFIGSHLAKQFAGRAEVTVLDDLRTGRRENLDGLRCTFIEGSILDPRKLSEAVEGVDLVFHLAAIVSVPGSLKNPVETVDVNVRGLLEVLAASCRADVKKLVFASSAAVYGENPTDPKVESLLPDPRSPYAVTKLDGEYFCAMHGLNHGLPTACLRLFNVFGPGQQPGGPYAAAVPAILERAWRNEPVVVFGDGLQTRDFIFVDDVVRAFAFAAESPEVTGVFNVGCGEKTSLLDLIQRIRILTGSQSVVLHADPRPGDVRHSTADCSKLLAAGWSPRISLADGLARMAGTDSTGR